MFSKPFRTVINWHSVKLCREDDIWLGQPIDCMCADRDADVAEAGEVQVRVVPFILGDLRYAVEELNSCSNTHGRLSASQMRAALLWADSSA